MWRPAMQRTCILLGIMIFVVTLAATAQENRSEISLQGAGFFTLGTSGNGTAYTATETGGLLTTYRYHLNHWAAAEAAYGYDANSQKYFVTTGAFRIQTGIHQATGSLVLNLPYRRSSRLNPYLLLGGGRSCSSRTEINSTRSQKRSRSQKVSSCMERA